MQSGDFILVKGTGFLDRLIQFGQSIRFGKKYAQWNHCAILISDSGELIEAINTGVKIGNISKYQAKGSDNYLVVSTFANEEDRLEIVRFAQSCIKEQYGWLNFISTAFAAVTGMKFTFGLSDTETCSGLVAKSLERGVAIFDYDSGNISPAYLAKYYLSINKPTEGVK